MNFIRIIIFLAVISPFMAILSGCGDDAFLDAIREEEDFITPFDTVISDEESKRTTYFPIADTGSVSSISEGDDGSYNNKPCAINLEVMNNVNGDGHDIVVDHVTGLTWTKCTATAYGAMDTDDNCSGSETDRLNDPALIEWSKAAATCKNLNYAGHKDWRLPRVPELLTIIDYGKHPSFDTAKFPNTRGDFEVPQYTDNHYSPDDRDRYIKGTNVLGQVTYTKVTPSESSYTSAKYIEEDGEYVFNEMFQDSYKPDDSGNYILAYIPYDSVVHYIKSSGPPVTYVDYSTLGAYTRYIKDGATYVDYNAVTHYIKIGSTYVDFIAATHYNKVGNDFVEDAGGAYIYAEGNYVNYFIELFWNGYYIKLSTNDYIHVATYISSNGEYICYSGEYINVNNQYVLFDGEYLQFDLQDRYNYDSTWGWSFFQNTAGTYIRLFIKDHETEYNPITGVPEPGSNYVKIYIPDLFTTWSWNGTVNTPTVTTFPAPPPYQGARARYRFDVASAKFVADAAGTYVQKFEKPIGYWTYSSKLMFDSSYNTSEFGWIVYPQNGGTFGVNMSSYSLKVKEDLTFEKQFVRCVRGGNGDSDDVD